MRARVRHTNAIVEVFVCGEYCKGVTLYRSTNGTIFTANELMFL